MIIVPTLSPGLLSRVSEEDGFSKYEHVVIADLRKGKRLMTSEPLWDESIIFETDSVGRPWRLFPTVQEVEWFFQRFTDACIRHPQLVRQGYLSLTTDVETTRDAPLLSQLINVGFGFRAPDEEQVINVPILSCGGYRYWSEPDEIYVRRLVARHLARPDICTALHNKSFDKAVLWAQGMPILGWSWCTMQAHHVWDGEMPHNLAFVNSLLTDGRYWKDDAKGDGGNLSIPDVQFRSYNCLRHGSRVLLADGSSVSIETLVRQKYTGKVLASTPDGHMIEARVYDWHQNRVANQKWLSIRTEETAPHGTGLVVTPDHKINVSGEWKEAQHLKPGDFMLSDEPYLTACERRLLLGTLLGDSSLRVSPHFRGKPFDAPSAYVDGGHVHADYTREKVRLLSHLLTEDTTVPPAGLRKTPFFPLRSRVFRQLRQFQAKLYDAKRVRRITYEALNEIEHEGFAWWIGDDGCRQKHRSGDAAKDTLCLALCRYPREDQELARAFFELKYGGAVYLGADGVLRFNLEATQNIATLVGPYLPLCVRYKLPGSEAVAYALRDVEPDATQASVVRVVSVTPVDENPKTRTERLRAETRYCISTTAGNFFTTTGLVKNCRDILATQRIQPTLHSELIRLRQWPLYIEELRAAEVMCRASIRGMLIDEERRMSPVIDEATGKPVGLGPAMQAQRDEATKMLRDLSGDPTFDPARPQKVQELFFQKLGFPVVLKSEKTGKPKVDKEALMLLELLAASREQKIGLRSVIQFRQAEKTLGTFVTGLGKFIHPATWRFHTQWKLLAVSGRFTSSPNAQNWSSKIKRMFKAAQRYKYVGVDLSQAELRYIAYLANDAALLRMYREGINVHTVNACLLFKIQCPEPKDLNPQTEKFIREEMLRVHGLDYSQCAVVALSNWKPIRTLAKNFVFGKNYGAQDETVFKVLRSKRDPETNKLLFPTLILSEIQALSVMWTKRLHPEIPAWWESIQIQTRKAGGYFCPISGRSRLYRGGYKQNEMLNCVDAETEALTRDRGWVRGFDLKRDDVLLTKNAERGELEWQPMTDLCLFPDRYVRTVEFRSRDFNAVSTLDHRWLVHDRKTGLDVCRTSAELNQNGMETIHRTGEMAGAGRTESLDMIELIGWFLTDASYTELPRKKTAPRPVVTIVQSPHANPHKVERIDALIARLGLKVWRGDGNVSRRGCATWQLDAAVSAWLHAEFPDRVLTPAFIASLSKAQAERLVDTMILGDGSRDGIKVVFGCGSKIKADMFQALCVVAGHATSLSVRLPTGRRATSPKVGNVIVAKKPYFIVALQQRKQTQVLARQRRESEGVTSVWCPIVPNTYFVARREGQVFITGNTPIQTGVASWMNKCMVEIQDVFDRETGGAAQIIQQVHDALNSEVPDEYTQRAGEVKLEILNRHFPLLGHNAHLPADKADVHEYLDKV